MRKLIIPFILLTLSLHVTNAQEQTATTPTAVKTQQAKSQQGLSSGTITSQFDYIYSSSNNYQDYKVVRKTSLEKLKSNVTDSLRSVQTKLTNIQNSLDKHDSEVSSLQDSLSKLNQELKTTKEQKESFSFLGIMLSKSAYNTLVWCLIGILFILLAIYVYRHKQSHSVTADARKTLEELKEEFDQHRKKAMEREQKLNRRLQDEINKKL